MKKELIDNIKKSSEKAELSPPDRIWNRLEYKLDRFEFDKKKERNNKLIYFSSVAAVLLLIISLIGFLKEDSFQYSINTQSTVIIDDVNYNDAEHQVSNVYILHELYSQQEDRLKYDFKQLKVNQDIN